MWQQNRRCLRLTCDWQHASSNHGRLRYSLVALGLAGKIDIPSKPPSRLEPRATHMKPDLDRINRTYSPPTASEVRLAAARLLDTTVSHESVDVAAFTGPPEALQVLLIKRSRAPFAGMYALPGGNVGRSEDPKLTAIRELQELTGRRLRDPSQLSPLGERRDPSRDPRLIRSWAFTTSLDQPTGAVECDDVASTFWVSLDDISAGNVALAFDHARVIRDGLKSRREWASLPQVSALTAIAEAADNRNSALVLGVNNEVGRTLDSSLEMQHETYLREYEMLKNESSERIKQRDAFINLNLIAIAAVASFALASPASMLSLFAIPWASACFGWAYLANDEKVTALSRYMQFWLSPRLGPDSLAWENSPKRATNIRGLHKSIQLLADLLQFVAPGIVAPLAYFVLTRETIEWNPFIIGLAITEMAVSVGLAVLFVLHSHLVKRWDVPTHAWETISRSG